MASFTVAKAPVAAPKAFKGLSKATKPAAKVANVSKASEMMVWTPLNNKMFETFSFLPPLSHGEIARQVDYIIANGWTGCLEFADSDCAYVQDKANVRFGNSASCNYYDNRYWTMWKLPMFGCTDPNQVLGEIDACKRAFPECYIRLVAFDNIAQCQTIGFLVNRPPRSGDFQNPENRSVA